MRTFPHAARDRLAALGLAAALVTGCSSGGDLAATEPAAAPAATEAGSAARFERFTYVGRDPFFEGEIPEGRYRNPVLAGFYPDPSITRAEGAYYLVNSTFAYYPGIPVFRSLDLVSWEQIGNVIDRPDMLDFGELGLSRGVFAPTIEHHDGVFYVANTCVDCGGNFVVTSEDPAGPWSDPIWLPEVGGIDPSLFFDDDGKVYAINNDAPEGEPRYDGHRAVWIREVNPETLQSVSEPVVLIDGGVRPEENPIWIEGPHIYKVDGTYYLSAAEGGTAINHSQVVLRSDTITGPYEPYPGNPILTARHLDPNRQNPIAYVGHADFVEDDEGTWWATFLGVRPYEGEFFNTGRETFLMEARWVDGWPVLMAGDEQVPHVADRPALPVQAPPAVPTSGNFTLTEEFDEALGPHWLFVRVPREEWWQVADGALTIEAREEHLGQRKNPSVITRRQQHVAGEASALVAFEPSVPGEEAGLVAMQSDAYWFKLGVGLDGEGERVVRLRRREGAETDEAGEIVAEVPLTSDSEAELRVVFDGGAYAFAVRAAGGAWRPVGGEQDGRILSTRTAGGFVGATLGMYAER